MANPQQTAPQFSNITPVEGGSAPAQTAAPAPTPSGQFTNIQPLPGTEDSSAAQSGAELPNSVFGNADTNSVAGNLVAGFSKEANKSAQGLIDLANKANRKLGGVGGDIPSLPVTQLGENLDTKGTAQNIGGGVENIAEFAVGDEALSGLAKAAKIVELGDKYPLIKRTLELAKQHPVIAKMIGEAGKSAVVGGAQGAVKGAAEGDAATGAKEGAIGGAVGGVVGTALSEGMGAAARWAGEKVGLIPNVVKDASVGMKPRKGNVNAVQDFLRIGPKLDEINVANGGGAATHEDWANIAKEARESVYQDKVEPLLQQYGTRPLSGIDIKNRISADIPETLKKVSPEKAAQVEQFAQQFMPGQVFQLTANEAEQYIQHFNAELTATGYWKLDPSSRSALEKVNPDIIKWKAAGDAIRDELYSKLGDWQVADHVANPVDMRAAKLDYGAARNVENELRGQINVQNRQSKISLKDVIALAAGIAHGGPGGAVIAALPVADKIFNSPAASFGRAVKAVGRPGEGAAARVVQGVSALHSAVPKASEMIGAEAPRLFFTASDGSQHSIPDNENALAHAKSIDPGLQVQPAPQQ